MSYALYAALYARVLRAFGGNTTASCRDRLLRQVSSPGASPLSAPFLVSDTPISFSLFKAVFRGTLKHLMCTIFYGCLSRLRGGGNFFMPYTRDTENIIC